MVRVDKTDGTVVTHAYDADGNRVRAEVTSPGGSPAVTDFLVDPSGALSHVVAESDASGNLIAYYVRGSDDLLSVVRLTEQRFYHADGLGSIRVLTDESGLLTDTYEYTAFGELLQHVGTDRQPYHFASEPFEPTLGFYYNRARWLDPTLGRFAGRDPFGGLTSDPATLHRYLYANADPVNLTDPSGRCFTLAGIVTAFSFQVGVRVFNALVVHATVVVGTSTLRFRIELQAKAIGEIASGRLGPKGLEAALRQYRNGQALIVVSPTVLEQFLTLATWLELGNTGIEAMGVVFKELAKVAPRFARISAVEDLIPPLQSEALEIAVSHFRLEKRTPQVLSSGDSQKISLESRELSKDVSALAKSTVTVLSFLPFSTP